jgi:benzoyl-CoA reductase subunit BamC
LTNPKRSRIRVFWDEDANLFVPILAGQYMEAECNGRVVYTINGKKYGECSFCRSSCPSRDLFKEPDADIPLMCDMCGEPPPPDGPSCVKGCYDDALRYVERDVEE